jgi:transcriptional regulator with XRE-family HTH domain
MPKTLEQLRFEIKTRPGNTLLAQRVLAERTRLEISQRELSAQAELPLGVLSRIESGEVSDPQVSTLTKLADIFEVSLDYLTGRSDVRGYAPREEQKKRLRSCLVLSWNTNAGRHEDSLEGFLPQAAFFSWAPKALTATITARVVSCGDACVSR